MLNFKKGSIFSRSEGNEDAYEEYEQEDQGGVLAVWGSPGSGKTTVAARIAKHLAGKHKNTILLLCDMSAPCCLVFVPPEIWRTRALWEAYWLPPMCPTA